MRTVVLLLLCSWVPVSAMAQADPVAAFADALTTKSAKQQLQLGQVITGSFDSDTTPRPASIWGAIRISATPKAIISLLRDCPNAPRYHKKLKFCEIVSHNENAEILHQQLKINWFSPLLDYTFRAEYSDTTIRYTLVSGDLKILQGGWSIYPEADASLLVYFISIKPDAPVPLWLISKILKSDITNTMLTLRERLSKGDA